MPTVKRLAKRVKNDFCRVLFIISFLLYIRFSFIVTDAMYNENGFTVTDAVNKYGFVLTIVLYSLSVTVYLNVPFAFLNVLGMLIFNPFVKIRKKAQIKTDTPFICFRVVTRGLFPELVVDITEMNLKTCREVGLKNFKFEIVTDNAIIIKTSNDVRERPWREVVVPRDYHTPNLTLFKARALHYCLNQNINILSSDDWIVHLDEETLLTTDVLYGIVKFVSNPDSNIGQGVITYGECGIANWFTTLLDGVRVAIDYGLFRLALQLFHRPVFGFKGSFVVVKMGIEADIGFDFGPKESIAEDLRFALAAWDAGYRFDFVEGVMREKSTFSISDFIKQRKRWFIGHFHVIWGSTLPLYCKCGVLPMHICSMLFWTNILNSFSSYWLPVPMAKWQISIFIVLTFHVFFMLSFGNFMSICHMRYTLTVRVVICLLSQFLLPILGLLEAYASLKGFLERNKISFDIVQKETRLLQSKHNSYIHSV